ncbi:hypothetical protein [Enterovibrio norvegicus]|uniref:hypothetical protein n=1 Tax=Enterovibrio norvegicus TaxID=188144 RepID=UPI00037F0F66|nr:hypothetical protein [Enterovibrio norvegicus]MCC4799160.1 hypothetical protein [Enterovibrio norvegicus]
MKKIISTLFIVSFAAMSLMACSADIGREMAEQDCSKIRNNADRDQCYRDVEKTFENY